MQLVAVENLVFQASWAAAGHSAPPTFHGVPYDNMKDDPATAPDEAHNFEPHFDRHVWIYRENPNGVFEPLNPAVKLCAPRREARGRDDCRRTLARLQRQASSEPVPGSNFVGIRIARAGLEEHLGEIVLAGQVAPDANAYQLWSADSNLKYRFSRPKPSCQ